MEDEPQQEDEPLTEDQYPVMDDNAAANIDSLNLDDELSESGDEVDTPLTESAEASEQLPEQSADPVDSSDDEYAPASQVKARLTQDPPSKPVSATNFGEDQESDTTPSTQAPKKGKAAQKRAKRAAAAAAVSAEQDENNFKCAACEGTFSSKTKLHQHIKEFPKHAALKSVTSGSGAKGKKSKR